MTAVKEIPLDGFCNLQEIVFRQCFLFFNYSSQEEPDLLQ